MQKVTIVLPTYNGEKYIRESIDSILSQTYTDWELIIVNDCSTDNTPKIIQQYSREDKRIRIINNSVNKKLPESLNIGFKYASGEYLTWTSDDNYYLCNAISKMVNFLDENREEHMVCAKMDVIDQSGRIIGQNDDYDNHKNLYRNCVGACFLYRKGVIREVGEYNPEWFLVEDYEYWMRVLFKYKNIAWLPDTLYRYRYHVNSLTETRKWEIKRQVCRLRKRYIREICTYLNRDIKYLGAIYRNTMTTHPNEVEIISIIEKEIPMFSIVKRYNTDMDTVIYGAGDYGNRALKRVGSKALYYIDSNQSKIGKKMNGLQIKSLDEYIKNGMQGQLMIAVSDEKVGEIIAKIYDKGIKTCCFYEDA